MSQKKQLQTHIDSLCEELGITEKQYKSDTTIAELKTIIDALEDQLPPENGEDQAEIKQEYEDDHPEGLAAEEQTDSQSQPEPEIPSGTEIGMMDESDLPDDAIIEDKPVKVNSDEKGDLEVKAKTTIYLVSYGKNIKIGKGKTAFIEESAAMQAVEEGVAVLLAE